MYTIDVQCKIIFKGSCQKKEKLLLIFAKIVENQNFELMKICLWSITITT